MIMSMSKRIVVTIIVYGILLITFGILSVSIYSISKSEDSQLAAYRWTYGVNAIDEENQPLRYTQLSAFIYEGVFDKDDVMQLRSDVESSLTQASISVQSNTSRLWIDAYSIETTISIENTQATVTAMGVGGDFFTFHNLPLLSGTYFDPEGNMTDLVLIDEVLAWQVFGSYDVIGLDIFISGTPYTVTGVVSRDYTDFANDTYGEDPRIYMPYETLNILNGNRLSITCYEALIPNPVSNFALNILTEKMSVTEKNVIFRENTTRYGLLNLYASIGDFNYRSMRQNNVIFPYWENIAVVKTDTCAILLLFDTFLLICLIAFTIYQIIYVKIKYKITFKNTIRKFEQIKNRKRLR